MELRRSIACAFVFAALPACAMTPNNIHDYMRSRGLEMPDAESLDHCHGYGCKFIKRIRLTPAEWKTVDTLFKPPPKTAEQERERIKLAIGRLEQIAGRITHTETDQAGTFRKLGDDQLDCVDESTNTTGFLMAMAERGLIRRHEILAPTMRLPIIHAGRWPHQTAVIRDKTVGTLYAVDSWFRDNGAPAEIVILEKWKAGWKPQNTGDSHL